MSEMIFSSLCVAQASVTIRMLPRICSVRISQNPNRIWWIIFYNVDMPISWLTQRLPSRTGARWQHRAIFNWVWKTANKYCIWFHPRLRDNWSVLYVHRAQVAKCPTALSVLDSDPVHYETDKLEWSTHVGWKPMWNPQHRQDDPFLLTTTT